MTMSTRPGERVLAAPEELGLDSRTAFRRAAGELLEQLEEGAGRLVIEDEAALRRTYDRFFAARYDVAFAGSGNEARRQLEKFHPEVLVLDLRLPDTDGVTLLQEIRASHPTLPVIVTTSYVSMEPLITVLDLGHSGYLVKPFDMDDLAARIDALG